MKKMFAQFLEVTENDVAAAILALAVVIQEKEIFSESFGHELSLGLQHAGTISVDAKVETVD